MSRRIEDETQTTSDVWQAYFGVDSSTTAHQVLSYLQTAQENREKKVPELQDLNRTKDEITFLSVEGPERGHFTFSFLVPEGLKDADLSADEAYILDQSSTNILDYCSVSRGSWENFKGVFQIKVGINMDKKPVGKLAVRMNLKTEGSPSTTMVYVDLSEKVSEHMPNLVPQNQEVYDQFERDDLVNKIHHIVYKFEGWLRARSEKKKEELLLLAQKNTFPKELATSDKEPTVAEWLETLRENVNRIKILNNDAIKAKQFDNVRSSVITTANKVLEAFPNPEERTTN